MTLGDNLAWAQLGLFDVDPEQSAPARVPIIDDAVRERFFHRVVETPHGCWIWTGAINSRGYGVVAWRSAGHRYMLTAHRFAVLAAGEIIPDGSVVEHVCNERLCCRVHSKHVRVTTQSENLRWAVECGRLQGSRRTGLPDPWRRSKLIRDALRDGWDAHAYHDAVEKSVACDCLGEQQQLFDLGGGVGIAGSTLEG